MTHSLPDPSLQVFDPEIERTISRTRQARRRLVLSEGKSETSLKEETSSFSIDSVDLRAGDMAAPRRVTIQEAGAPHFTLQPRDGADETSILLKAFPFSLEEKAREWYYAQPRATVANWDTLRREFLEKFFPAEVTDRLRKEISMIVQGESETLHEYWECFNNLLEACPHHMIEKLVLLGYFIHGMKPQDKTTLEGVRNESMKKYKTTDEAWQLISDLTESTRNHRQKQSNSKAVTEVSSSKETTALTQSICEMTNLLKQMQLSQQQAQQAQPFLPQQGQQLLPQRVCGICANYSHYTDEFPQLQQEDNTVTATHNFYDRPNQGYNQGGSYNHGWQDNSNQSWRDNSSQALVSQIESLNNSNNQPLSSSGIPSQPLPNPKGGINAITLRFGTTLQGRNPEKPSPLEHAPAEDMAEVEDVEEEDEAQGMAEVEAAQPKNAEPQQAEAVRDATPIPFSHLARKARKQTKLDPKMTSKFKLDAFLGTYSFEVDGRIVSFNLDEAMKHPPKDHSIF
ncbi:uncharacterized protein LOC130966170 [Arachis stenosperma]|uniref:uncharacterized protein LOC130966170 n=1 Tax=Arachis stenosperma TaxID=217475 RepID=UPI0025AD03CF|nr:uncharacterized protein LOC130966170 [Arachis stenosperma]